MKYEERGIFQWIGESTKFHKNPSLGSDEINPLNAKLNPTCHLLALLGAHPILHISRIRVKR